MNVGRGLGFVKFFDVVYLVFYLFRVFFCCIYVFDYYFFVCGLFGYGFELKVKDGGVRLFGIGFI